MTGWELYQNRINVRGLTKNAASRRRETHLINDKLPDNLSYTEVVIDGASQTCAVINTDNLNEKFIYSMPGEDITHGSIVEWMGNHWLVTEKDANYNIYRRAKLEQCNYELKWVLPDTKEIHSEWCIVEDGTKLIYDSFRAMKVA